MRLKVSSRVKNHHFSKFAIFRRLNRAHQELSFKKKFQEKISDAHEWINEIPTIPIYYLVKPQQRERTL